MPPNGVEIAAFAVSQALIVADCWTTLDFRSRGDPETNPILGAYPSNQRVVLACAMTMATTSVLWLVLPSPWRNVVTLAIVPVETYAVVHNYSMGARIRF